jgi:TPR repeat protein
MLLIVLGILSKTAWAQSAVEGQIADEPLLLADSNLDEQQRLNPQQLRPFSNDYEYQQYQQQESAQPQPVYQEPYYPAPTGGGSAIPATPPATAELISSDPATAAFQRGDYKTAARLLRADALKGDANAQHNLGYMYEQGMGVDRDLAQAFTWYSKSADQGFAASQNDLGAMYADGIGVPQDLVRAYVLFTQAATTGDEDTLRLALSNLDQIKGRMSYEQFSEAVRQSHELQAR